MDNNGNNNYNFTEEPKTPSQEQLKEYQQTAEQYQQNAYNQYHENTQHSQNQTQYQQNAQQYQQNAQYSRDQTQYQQRAQQQYQQQYQQQPNPNYAYTYGPNSGNPGNATYVTNAPKKGMPGWAKALIIIACVLIFTILLGVACSKAVKNVFESVPVEDYNYPHHYIGVVYLTGTIADGESGDGYNHSWMLNRIDDMAVDPMNKGLVLFVETPGGSAYASRELYLDLLSYKETTGRPIYVYMGSQATSGGYYVAMAADKIYANEECWTGSIGVIIGSLYDLSGLMEKYGVKAENIVSGKNKDIGTNIKPMTDEQREILQSLVDDSFDRFVKAVVDGRKISESKVRELADGRIYTANQALEHNLIDAIGTVDDAVSDMQNTYGLSDASPELMQYNPPADLRSYLGFGSLLSGRESSNSGISYSGDLSHLSPEEMSDLAALFAKLDQDQQFELLCIAPIKK